MIISENKKSEIMEWMLTTYIIQSLIETHNVEFTVAEKEVKKVLTNLERLE